MCLGTHGLAEVCHDLFDGVRRHLLRLDAQNGSALTFHLDDRTGFFMKRFLALDTRRDSTTIRHAVP
jgi:hypothetical protein